MSAMSRAGSVAGRASSLRNPFRLLVSTETWLAFVFMVLSFVVGLFWFLTLITLISVGVGLAITLIGIPILIATMYLWIYGAKLERARVQGLLGTAIRDPHLPAPEGGARPFWARFNARLLDRHTWLDLLYLGLLFPIGIAEIVVALTAVFFPLFLITTPTYAWSGEGVDIGGTWRIDTLPETLVALMLGVPLLLLMPYILIGVGRGHAWLARHLLGTDREAELTARVDQLTDTRSRAVDSAISELRRIERDLHDGAQQRLVKLSMDLGMAREKMASDPAAAQLLIEEAHEEAKRAMSEIRDLARGIHPAVLTDRGLDAAISALAGRATTPVTVDVELDRRLPGAVESTAYFIVAEALTNIARHSGATEASVTIRQAGDRLLIDIEDDGIGRAEMTRGTGLRGMADRAAALDGTLTLDSPEGGPTRIHVELPCES